MRTVLSVSPCVIQLERIEDDDPDWSHTLTFEDETGSSVTVMLSAELFQELWQVVDAGFKLRS